MTAKKATAGAAAPPKPKAAKPVVENYEYTGDQTLSVVIPENGGIIDFHPGDVVRRDVLNLLGLGFYRRADFERTSKKAHMQSDLDLMVKRMLEGAKGDG